jgi:hypothetical protein
MLAVTEMERQLLQIESQTGPNDQQKEEWVENVNGNGNGNSRDPDNSCAGLLVWNRLL